MSTSATFRGLQPESSALIAAGVTLVDLMFGGEPRSIGSALIETSSGIVIVDPGPSTTLDALERGLDCLKAGWNDVRALLLTHLHLDHAGAAGTIAALNPTIHVFAHASAAPHLADPRRLLRSAAMIFGDDLDKLWGEVLPTPADRIVALDGGENIRVDGREFAVAWTPGHARHHLCFLDTSSGAALVGDAAGVRISGAQPVVPVTPPPDVDLDAWREGVRRIRAWQPHQLLVTHYGCATDPLEHLDRHGAVLHSWETRVRAELRASAGEAHESMAMRFAADVASDLTNRLEEPSTAREYLRSIGPEDCWYGLVRYCSRKP